MTVNAKPLTALEALQAARARIARRYGWCREAFVKKTSRGVQYCAVGALFYPMGEAAGDASVRHAALAALERALPARAFGSVTYYNDKQRDKRYILRVYDRAIAALKAAGKGEQ